MQKGSKSWGLIMKVDPFHLAPKGVRVEIFKR